jgi:hypothetical protein
MSFCLIQYNLLTMRQQILNHLEDPDQLEKLYRSNSSVFVKVFNSVYPEIKDEKLAQYWHVRLSYERSEISWGTKNDWIFILLASLVAGLMAKIPAIFQIKPEFFYTRNIGFIVFPALASYFIWKRNIPLPRILFTAAAFVIAAVYINFLPDLPNNDTIILACLHVPFLLWALLGINFVGLDLRNDESRLDFLRFNGDFLILSGILVIVGGLFTAIVINLFMAIGIKIEDFYFDYLAVFAGASLPIISTFLTQSNPSLVNKVSPVVAKICSPVVLIMLIVYLGAVLFSDKDPYNDRNFLLVFNLLLLGVMAIILFSLAETAKDSGNSWSLVILLALSVVTMVVNGIAFTAILFRISEWGLTPNRLAILGANFLMLANLVFIAYRLFNRVIKKDENSSVENAIANFLPIYILWAMVVVFVFPLLFNFR